ncbi:MAG TPA: enoyl-CoA hydratase/isomerase family protein, partial [Planctomycetes bacterium]|nr:enoyl-CoA hydratase/isomerase family protein [Planctomycetota bacterium]
HTSHDGIAELRLDRPAANALSPTFLTAIADAVERAAASGARAIVLSGAPGMFSAGLDVPCFLELDRDEVRLAWIAFFRAMRAIACSPVPVVGALTGHAPAGGCVLALCCDWRVLAEGRFKIGLNEVAVGVRVPGPIFAAAAHVVGLRGAERMCTTAKLFSPEEALDLGLVDEVVPPEDVVPRALERAGHFTTLPPVTLARTRELCRADLAASLDAMAGDELERFLDEWFGEECQGALRALLARLAGSQ